MTKIENQTQYEWAVKRVEDLLPLVKDDTPLNDPNSIELELLSNLVADYSEEHFSLGEPSLVDVLKLRMYEMGLNQKSLSQLIGVSPSRLSDYISGKFIEKGDSSSTWINGGDLHIREIIESELKEIAKNRTGILYSFDKDTKAVEIDYSSSDYDNNKKAGTYEWDKDSLTLNFNNNISKHGFAVVNDHTIIIVLDFTEKYKSKYPNASVKGAKIQCFLSAIE